MADKPDRLTFLGDYAKTVITLSTGLLAVSVTFADKLVAPSASKSAPAAVATLWIALSLSIFAALWMVAYLTSVLRLENQIKDQEVALQNAAQTPAHAQEHAKLRSLRGKRDKAETRLGRGTNLTYWMMAIAVGALLVIGFRLRTPVRLPDIVAYAKHDAAQLRNIDVSTLTLSELRLSSEGLTYYVTLKRQGEPAPLLLEIDATNGRIRQLH